MLTLQPGTSVRPGTRVTLINGHVCVALTTSPSLVLGRLIWGSLRAPFPSRNSEFYALEARWTIALPCPIRFHFSRSFRVQDPFSKSRCVSVFSFAAEVLTLLLSKSCRCTDPPRQHSVHCVFRYPKSNVLP